MVTNILTHRMNTKVLAIVLCMASSVLVSCRKEEGYFMNPNDPASGVNACTSYVAQFEAIWSAINTGYVFWDITDVDWNARYNEFLPEFEKLDAQYKRGTPASKDQLQKLYNGLTANLVDHHLHIWILNIHNSTDTIKVRPSSTEIQNGAIIT